MKYLFFYCFSILFLFSVSSCIRSEAPNAEADIISCKVTSPAGVKDDVSISGKYVTILVDSVVEHTALGIEFQLTPGATISPASGTVRDFTNPQNYTVTSEDGKWKKTYTVNVTSVVSIPQKFSFENAKVSDEYEGFTYYTFYELNDLDTLRIWDSGNSGFALMSYGESPDAYPTVSYPEGKVGKCLKLETLSTGKLGAMFKKPIAAGNLFLGRFNGDNAVLEPLKATEFGAALGFWPTKMTGYYKYKAGPVVTDAKGAVVGGTDTFDIYSIIFEKEPNRPYLDGSNSLTSDQLIAIARMPQKSKKETDKWTKFSLPFVIQPGKVFDEKKLLRNEYSISIVFSSSIDGADFRGAIGSTLFIDEINLLTEE